MFNHLRLKQLLKKHLRERNKAIDNEEAKIQLNMEIITHEEVA